MISGIKAYTVWSLLWEWREHSWWHHWQWLRPWTLHESVPMIGCVKNSGSKPSFLQGYPRWGANIRTEWVEKLLGEPRMAKECFQRRKKASRSKGNQYPFWLLSWDFPVWVWTQLCWAKTWSNAICSKILNTFQCNNNITFHF